MEAGYDYLLLRGRFQQRFARFTGVFLLVFGILLLASGGAYYGYAAKARSNLDTLQVSVDFVPSPAAGDPFVPPPRVVPSFSPTAISDTPLYPGDSLSADSWNSPRSYEPLELREQALLQGFTSIDPDDPTLGPIAPANRIIIPAIGIDSTVTELSILDLENSRTYETPKNAVGHIPETANAGEAGDSWFFGHTESPLRGEGSVFFTLQNVPKRLKNGETVYIITDNGSDRFLYRATGTRVVHQDDMRLTESEGNNIHLVSCVPRFGYTHRLIVTGELIATDAGGRG